MSKIVILTILVIVAIWVVSVAIPYHSLSVACMSPNPQVNKWACSELTGNTPATNKEHMLANSYGF